MLYFSVLALSVLTLLALGVLAAFMIRYPQGWTALADSEIDHLTSKGIMSESLGKWFREHRMGRFAKIFVGALFVVSLVSTALLMTGPV